MEDGAFFVEQYESTITNKIKIQWAIDLQKGKFGILLLDVQLQMYGMFVKVEYCLYNGIRAEETRTPSRFRNIEFLK